MPNDEIWPGRDDEMLYPLDARGSGRSRPVSPRRRSRGLLVTLLWLIFFGAVGGGAYLWLYLPKAQQLLFTSQLLEQATQSATLLRQRVEILEEQKQQAAPEPQAAPPSAAMAKPQSPDAQAAPPAPIPPAHVDALQQMRDALTEALAPLADQRHLQLLPHEQGLAVHLLVDGQGLGRTQTHLSRDAMQWAGKVAEDIAKVMQSRQEQAMLVAFRCVPPRAKARELRAAQKEARQLTQAIVGPTRDTRSLRVVTAIGAPDWGWKIPSNDQQTPTSCFVIDVRSGA